MNTQQQQTIFKQIIVDHAGILKKVGRIYCASADDREDLLQETLIQLWRSLPSYRPGAVSYSTWTYRVALNVAISYYRKNQVRMRKTTPLSDNINPISPENDDDKEAQLRQLEHFIDELKELDKALILLYLEGKNHRETADIMGVSVSNVGTRIARIKEKLRTKFSTFKTNIK